MTELVIQAPEACPMHPCRLAIRSYTVLSYDANCPALRGRRGSTSTSTRTADSSTSCWVIARIEWIVRAVSLFLRHCPDDTAIGSARARIPRT